MIVRQATQADIPVLVSLRMGLFCEVGELSDPLVDVDLWQATSAYFSTAQADGSARSWVAEVGGEVVASGTLHMRHIAGADLVDTDIDDYEMVVFDGGNTGGDTWKHVFFPRQREHNFVYQA